MKRLLIILLIGIAIWALNYFVGYWVPNPIVSLIISILGALAGVGILLIAKEFGLTAAGIIGSIISAAVGGVLVFFAISLNATEESILVDCSTTPPTVKEKVEVDPGWKVKWSEKKNNPFTVKFDEHNNHGWRKSPFKHWWGQDIMKLKTQDAKNGQTVKIRDFEFGDYKYAVICGPDNQVDPIIQIPRPMYAP